MAGIGEARENTGKYPLEFVKSTRAAAQPVNLVRESSARSSSKLHSKSPNIPRRSCTPASFALHSTSVTLRKVRANSAVPRRKLRDETEFNSFKLCLGVFSYACYVKLVLFCLPMATRSIKRCDSLSRFISMPGDSARFATKSGFVIRIHLEYFCCAD